MKMFLVKIIFHIENQSSLETKYVHNKRLEQNTEKIKIIVNRISIHETQGVRIENIISIANSSKWRTRDDSKGFCKENDRRVREDTEEKAAMQIKN